jgi:flagellar biosynthetic protein FliR
MVISSPFFLLLFAVAVRTTTAIMLLPGFSASQVPMRARLFVALGVAVSIVFILNGKEQLPVFQETPDALWFLKVTLSEMAAAAVLALPVRFLFLSLAFAGEVSTQFIGLNPIPGSQVGDTQPMPTLAAFFNITAVVLFFVTGIHLQFILGLALSFDLFPPGEFLNASGIVQSFAEELSTFFNIALRLTAPILVYSVVVNLIAGIVNKLTPQVPIYFVSTPFLIIGGLYVFVLIGKDIIFDFNVAVGELIDKMF